MAQHRTFWQSLLDYIRGEDFDYTTVSTAENIVEPPQEEDVLPEYITSAYDNQVYPDLDHVTQLRVGPAHLHGEFKQLSGRYARSGLYVTEGVFSDNTGSVRVVWFNQRVASVIRPNEIYELRGNFDLKRQRLQITNAKFHKLSEGCESFDKTKQDVTQATTPPAQQYNIWTSPIEGKGLSSDSKWRALKTKVLIRDSYACAVCGGHTNLTVDHKTELSLGGTNAMSNLQVLCKECHEDKHYRNFLDRKFDAVDDYGINYEPTIKIKALAGAIKNGSGVAISYKDREGVHSYRVIHPKKMYKGYRYKGTVVNKRMVYVDAYCELDKAGRTFRISRMTLMPSGSKSGITMNSYS